MTRPNPVTLAHPDCQLLMDLCGIAPREDGGLGILKVVVEIESGDIQHEKDIPSFIINGVAEVQVPCEINRDMWAVFERQMVEGEMASILLELYDTVEEAFAAAMTIAAAHLVIEQKLK